MTNERLTGLALMHVHRHIDWFVETKMLCLMSHLTKNQEYPDTQESAVEVGHQLSIIQTGNRNISLGTKTTI